ncbi:hypothetical protein LB505_014230 [Fusarium chuoi]|nr:hypothetical protein LB505_014230 [Fusarium chuoi]
MAVHRWLKESSNSTAESDLLIDIPRAPLSDVSGTLHSQILEDHPALLSYATFALFEHARLAPIDGADVTPILDRLNDETTWARFGPCLMDQRFPRSIQSWSKKTMECPFKRRPNITN